MLAIDCAENYGPQAERLKALGVDAVIRYFNPLSDGRDSGKSLTAEEARQYAAAGLQVGIVVEGYGLSNGTGVDGPSGTRDATEVLAWLPTVGMPLSPELTVWFAVDTDATAAQINNNEVNYFDAINRVFSTLSADRRPVVGIYGSGWSCLSMNGTRRAAKTWVAGSKGWALVNGKMVLGTKLWSDYSVYVASGAWTLLQHIWPDEKWEGFNADTNTVNETHGSPGFVFPFLPTDVPPMAQPQNPA